MEGKGKHFFENEEISFRLKEILECEESISLYFKVFLCYFSFFIGNLTYRFSPPEMKEEGLSTDWLFNYTAKVWSDWLPNDTLHSIERGGYYTSLIRPGLRLITLNNNDCYVYNWWTFYSTDSQVEQLQWLHDILLEAEVTQETVHILAHIPPGEGSCFKIWSREYRRIIERFSHIIKAQFHGHTHYDEFNIFYGRDNDEIPIGVAWNGGSISSYSDVNPNYVIYDIGKTSFVSTL